MKSVTVPSAPRGRIGGETLRAPSFKGLQAAGARAQRAAQASSRKQDTRCELLLRRELWRRGLRYRLAFGALPGRPDLVFPSARLVIFCDGDFWHGRDLAARLQRLEAGHNAPYWVAKIQANHDRDLRTTAKLVAGGWRVLRFWESDISRDAVAVAKRVEEILRAISLLRVNSKAATRPTV